MEQFIKIVQDWGYWAVFFGSLVEGESVILTASAMAKAGYLSIYKIMIIAFWGTLIADQGLYQVGRHYGPSIFNRFPRYQKPADRAFNLLKKYDVWFIIACRFVYGIRITSAVVIGASGISPYRFIPLNILSALIWTVVSCTGGYLLGDVVIDIFNNFEHIQKYIIFALIFIGLIVGIFIYFKKRIRNGS